MRKINCASCLCAPVPCLPAAPSSIWTPPGALGRALPPHGHLACVLVLGGNFVSLVLVIAPRDPFFFYARHAAVFEAVALSFTSPRPC